MTSHMALETAQLPGLVAQQLTANEPVWRALAEQIHAFNPSFLMTVARGSSDHAATFAKYLFELYLGTPVVSAAPSVFTVYQRSLKLHHAVVFGLSQSGQSPDICTVMESVRNTGALTIAVVNQVDSPLAQLAEQVVPVRAGIETAVAATKSYVLTIIALIQGVAIIKQDQALLSALQRLPEALEKALQRDWSPLLPALQNCQNALTLGRGFGFAIAQEAALKFKETCQLQAEAFSSAEVLHGPFALIKPGYPVVAFLQNDATLAGNVQLATRIAQLGGQVWLAMPHSLAPIPEGCKELPLPPSLHETLDPVIAITAFYRMVERLAHLRGYSPDQPNHLQKVTKTS